MRTLTEIMTNEINLAHPMLLDEDFDSMEEIEFDDFTSELEEF